MNCSGRFVVERIDTNTKTEELEQFDQKDTSSLSLPAVAIHEYKPCDLATAKQSDLNSWMKLIVLLDLSSKGLHANMRTSHNLIPTLQNCHGKDKTELCMNKTMRSLKETLGTIKNINHCKSTTKRTA